MVTACREMNSRFDDPDYSYWMYLVISEFLQDYGPLEDFVQLVSNFGRVVDEKASVVIPFQDAYRDTRNYVLNQSWNSATRSELQNTLHPFILILKTPLARIDAEKDEIIILKFPEALAYSERYVELFSEIADEIFEGKDLFEWKHAKHRKEVTGKVLNRIAESLSIKPGLLGFSIDVKKLLTGT
jgi:hypothetical protein